MRATVEQVKAAILYPDVDVREAAVCFFRNSPEVDATIMPLVVRAYQQYSQNAFSIPNVWTNLPQTGETLDWIIAHLQNLEPPTNEVAERFAEALVSGLCCTEASLLEPRLPAIRALESLDDESKEVIEDRVFLSTFSCDQLWSELFEFCAACEEDEGVSEADIEFANTLVENLSRFPAEVTAKVRMILQDGVDSQSYPLDDLVVELAGRLRLEEAIPLLVTRLQAADPFSGESAHRALENIGTDAVVIEIQQRYALADADFRLAMATTLEDVHTDLSVRTSLELFTQEGDADIKGLLLQAALMNFAAVAIEPARQFIQSQAKSPDLLEVRMALLTACKLLGETFPEMEEWLEESKHDTEFRRQWYKDHPLNRIALSDDEFDDGAAFEDEVEDESADEPDIITVRHGDEHKIGRNHPCPCGSGKKYKKCCARREEPDGQHARVMSRASQPEKVTYPIGTIANYGPDDQTTTKIVAGVIKRAAAEPIIERWVGTKITQNPKVQRQIKEFLKQHGVNSVVYSEGNMGCPHEEGFDFPEGEECPFCPFWAGKQGSNRRT